MTPEEEKIYQEAFDKAIESADRPLMKFQQQEEKPVENSSTNEEKENSQLDPNEWADKEKAQRNQAEQEADGQEQPVRRRGRPRKEPQQDADVEYEKLYRDYKQNADSQIGLYKARLQQLAQDYQKLKAEVDKKPEEPEQLPSDVQEVFEMYPDIAKAVSSYVDAKISKTKQSFTKDLEQQIQPIRSHLVLSDVQKHEMAINAAHPDLKSILASGDLTDWIESLPPVMKAGAQQVYQYGDTNAVIALLDEYKQQRGISNAPRSSRKQPGNNVPEAARQNADGLSGGTAGDPQLLGMEAGPGNGGNGSPNYRRNGQRDNYGYFSGGNSQEDQLSEDDPLVQRVMAALAVKSNKTPVDINAAPRQRTKTADDIFKEITAQYEADMKRRR